MRNNVNLYKFGQILKSIRLERKLTQAELAEKVELSTNFIGMVERGLRNTTIDKMFLLMDALEISPLQFFERF